MELCLSVIIRRGSLRLTLFSVSGYPVVMGPEPHQPSYEAYGSADEVHPMDAGLYIPVSVDATHRLFLQDGHDFSDGRWRG
jgi:hypothetical protein